MIRRADRVAIRRTPDRRITLTGPPDLAGLAALDAAVDMHLAEGVNTVVIEFDRVQAETLDRVRLKDLRVRAALRGATVQIVVRPPPAGAS